MKQITNALRRINRAKKHLDILNREVSVFIASKPYRCAIDKDPQDGCYIFSPYLKDGFPTTWGLLVGEVAHGLRSALDNIAWALAIKRDTHTVFPIYIEENTEFTNRLERLRKDIWTDVKAVQPYNKHNGEKRRHPLWVLHRIDNIDKHRIILPGVTRIYVATGLLHPKWFFMDGFICLNKGDVQFKLTTPTTFQKDFKPDMKGQVAFDISSLPANANDPPRILLKDLFLIHYFIRNDVYPRFAKLLEPIDGIK
jgi:hypothetical protein